MSHIHWACNEGHLKVAEMLLDKGNLYIYITLSSCYTAFTPGYCEWIDTHTCIWTHKWINMILWHMIYLITLCVLYITGADISAVDNKGRTPLHLACKKGHIQVAAMILDKGNCHIHITLFSYYTAVTVNEQKHIYTHERINIILWPYKYYILQKLIYTIALKRRGVQIYWLAIAT